MNSRAANRGFTLLEVLVAFVILALVLGALFQSFNSSLSAAHLGDRYSRALIIAQSKLAALEAEYMLAEGVTTGTDDGTFHWRITITPYTDDLLQEISAPVEPMAVDVTVFWETGAAPRTVSLKSMLLRSIQ